jgi:hypothetical protein
LFQPVGAGVHAVAIDGRSPMGNLWGFGVDLSLFRGGSSGVYLVGGLEGGFLTRGQGTLWGSWSGGLGYEIFPLNGLSVAVEGRYRDLREGRYHGVEMGLRLGLGGGGTRRASPRTEQPPPTADEVRQQLADGGVTSDDASVLASVVGTALDVMGMPYRWGEEGGDGFDCSGLIRYAFAQHGITLPRRSADQARAGREVGRELTSLRAGDVLTFSTTGQGVSHVGLYLGNGRFIHSASSGVQISLLSPDDASGRWWFQRWTGARRIVG